MKKLSFLFFFLLTFCLFQPSRLDAQIPNEPILCGMTGSPSGVTSTSTTSSPLPICTDASSIRYVRVAIHYILSESNIQRTYIDGCGPTIVQYNYSGPGNFTEYGDGNGSSTYNGFNFAEDLMASANLELGNSLHGRKTPGETYPDPPPTIPMRLILTGVYFHRDNQAFSTTNNASATHALYDIESNNVIDVYIGWWPNTNWGGNSFGYNDPNKFCYINMYDRYLQPNCRVWAINQAIGSTINHEIYHTLDVYHTWNEIDGCLDTPMVFLYDQPLANGMCVPDYANCWKFDPSLLGCPKKPCDDWQKISNNIMDYNESYPHATTLCQISRINTTLNASGNSYIHSCNGCIPTQAFFFMEKEVILCTPYSIFMNGQASSNEDQYLIEICEVSDSDPNTCIDGYYNSGWKNGKVGKINLKSFYNFKADKSYKIKLTTASTTCPGTDEWTQTLKTTGCYALAGACCFEVYPTNPVTDGVIRVSYHIPNDGPLSFSIVNLVSSQVTVLQTSEDELTGDYQKEFYIGNLPLGTYALQAVYRGQSFSKTIIKQ